MSQNRRPFPLRVLYHYPHQHMDTGSPRALVNLIELLDAKRFQPWFLAEGDGPLITALEERGVRIIHGQVREISLRRPRQSMFGIARQALLLGHHRIDLLHMHGFGWSQDLVVAAGIRRIPVVLHLHNPAKIHPRNLNRLIARRILLVSHAQEGTITGFERIRPITSILHNTIDMKRYSSGRSIRPALHLSDDQFAIGCVAQIKHIKGIHILVEAARKLLPAHPELVFLLAGPPGKGEEEYSRRLIAASKNPVFGGRLRFLGSRDDIPDLLASLDAFVLPALREPFGIAVIEAMAAGLPVIAAHVGGIPEIISSSGIGLLLPEVTPKCIENAIEDLLRRPDRGCEMGRRGRDSLFGRFDSVTVGHRLEQIYLDLREAR